MSSLEEFEQITPEQTPSTEEWSFVPLYKKNLRGNQTRWQVGFDGESLISYFGVVGGKMRETMTQVTPKGKRNMQEQALLQARRKYEDKVRKEGYGSSLEEGETKTRLPQPMLAKKWEEHSGKIKFPLAVQPKLDGIRCLASMSGDEVILRSRGNKLFSFLNHIRQEVRNLLSFLPPETVLDGEFYSKKIGFQQITSIVRKTKTRDPRENDLEYHIFDLITPENLSFLDRYKLLEEAFYEYDLEAGNDENDENLILHLVPYDIIKHSDEIIEFHDAYVQEGYEGIIIRDPESPYIHNRTDRILKYKSFIDEETTVIGVEEGKGTEIGLAILLVEDIRGNQFRVRPRGAFAERRKWFQNPEIIVGKKYTIRYQELSDDNVPRFPVGVSIRDYE